MRLDVEVLVRHWIVLFHLWFSFCRQGFWKCSDKLFFKMDKDKERKPCDLKNCSRQLFKFVQIEMNVLQDCKMKSRDHLHGNIFVRGFRKPRENRIRWYILFAVTLLLISMAVIAITLAIYFGTGNDCKSLLLLLYGQNWSVKDNEKKKEW